MIGYDVFPERGEEDELIDSYSQLLLDLGITRRGTRLASDHFDICDRLIAFLSKCGAYDDDYLSRVTSMMVTGFETTSISDECRSSSTALTVIVARLWAEMVWGYSRDGQFSISNKRLSGLAALHVFLCGRSSEKNGLGSSRQSEVADREIARLIVQRGQVKMEQAGVVDVVTNPTVHEIRERVDVVRKSHLIDFIDSDAILRENHVMGDRYISPLGQLAYRLRRSLIGRP